MKKTILTLALIAGMGAVALAGGKEINLKPEASKVEWVGKKVTGEHTGVIMLKQGKMMMEGNELVGGTFEIDMTTLKCTDLEGDMNGKLVGHLKSPDFFDVANHATSSLVITKVEKKADGAFTHKLMGELTIKGQSHPVTFPAKIEVKDGKVAAYAEMTVDRSKYDVRYGSPSFFNDLGDKAIYDDFELKVSLGAKM